MATKSEAEEIPTMNVVVDSHRKPAVSRVRRLKCGLRKTGADLIFNDSFACLHFQTSCGARSFACRSTRRPRLRPADGACARQSRLSNLPRSRKCAASSARRLLGYITASVRSASRMVSTPTSSGRQGGLASSLVSYN